MKGVIAMCLKEMVIAKFGRDKWEAALLKAGLPADTSFLATENVDDAAVMKVIGAVCSVLGVSATQAADAFGDYWVNSFAPRIYPNYYRGVKTAREFLMNMSKVHKVTTDSMADARPPRFEYELKAENVLVMQYHSHRDLIDIMIGLIKGVGNYFKENLSITRLGKDKVEIVFQGAKAV